MQNKVTRDRLRKQSRVFFEVYGQVFRNVTKFALLIRSNLICMIDILCKINYIKYISLQRERFYVVAFNQNSCFNVYYP